MADDATTPTPDDDAPIAGPPGERWLDRRSITVAAVSVLLLGAAFALGLLVGGHGHGEGRDGRGGHGGRGDQRFRHEGGFGGGGRGFEGRSGGRDGGMERGDTRRTAPTSDAPA